VFRITREDLLLDDDLLAVLELDDVFHRDHDLVDTALHVHGLGPRLEVLLDLLLVARLRVHDIPTTRAVIRALDGRLQELVLVEDLPWGAVQDLARLRVDTCRQLFLVRQVSHQSTIQRMDLLKV